MGREHAKMFDVLNFKSEHYMLYGKQQHYPIEIRWNLFDLFLINNYMEFVCCCMPCAASGSRDLRVRFS